MRGLWPMAMLLAMLTAAPASAQDFLPQPPSTRQMVKNARELYAKGEYEAAAQLYLQAQGSKDTLTPPEQADLKTQMQQNATAQKARLDGVILLDQVDSALKVGKATEAEAYLRLAAANQFLAPADKQRMQAMTQALGQLRVAQKDTNDPAALLLRAREALKRGDYETAEALAKHAEKARSFLSPLAFWNDTPARVLDEVRLARTKTPAASIQIAKDPLAPPPPPSPPGKENLPSTAVENAPKTAVVNYSPMGNLPPSPNPEGANANAGAGAKEQVKRLVLEGYKALETNELEKARDLAAQAKKMNVELAWWEANPDKLNADIQRRITVNEIVAGGNDPVALLRQGRAFYLQQRYDEAERLAQIAESHNRRYGLFEDSPKKLKDDIVRARGQMDAGSAAKLVSEARRALKAGNFADAKSMATAAKNMTGQGSAFWTWADTPDAVLRDVARLDKNGTASVPTDIAQLPQPGQLESPQVKAEMKNRAITLIVEARNLERQGHLTEARAKAVEAQKVFSAWSLNEESPAAVLQDLNAKAANRIKSLLDQATEVVNNNPGDTSRFSKADSYLVTARRLAESFRLDTMAIDQRAQWLQLAMMQSRSGSPLAANPLQSVQQAKINGTEEAAEPGAADAQKDALDKLAKARLELKAGNHELARRLTTDAYTAIKVAKGNLDPAEKMLRECDIEEHNQNVSTAHRNYQAGMDAFRRKDFKKAALIFQNVNVALLPQEQARKIGEIIESPELREGLQLVGGQAPPPDVPSKGSPIPAPPQLLPTPPEVVKEAPIAPPVASPIPPPATAAVGNDPHLEAAKEMRKIAAGKFRDMRIAAEQRAQDLAKSGKEDKAIEMLQDFQVKLKESGLEDVHITSLNRPIEDRIQKLRAAQAKKELDNERRSVTNSGYKEQDRTDKQLATQKKVAEILSRGTQLFKEGQYAAAKQKADIALELDPDNVSAGALRHMCDLKKNVSTHERIQEEIAGHVIDGLNPNTKDLVNYDNPLRAGASKDLWAKQRKSFTAMELSPKNSKELLIERKLSQPTSLNFQDVPLYRVLQDLQVLSGINIVPDRQALSDQGISLEQQMSFNINDISLKSALTLLLKQVNLTYVIKHEVIEITTHERSQGKQKMITYPIADLVVPVDDHPTSAENSFSEALKRHISSTGGGVRYTPPVPYSPQNGLQYGQTVGTNNGQTGTPGQQGYATKSNSNTIEHLVINLITNTIQPNTWESTGGQGRIQYFPLGHALVVSQIQEVQEEVQALLNALRRLQDIQISIEMRIVSVSEKFFERIGVDFDVNIRTPTYRVENQLINGQYAPFGSVQRNLGVNRVVTGMTPAGQLTPDLNVPIKSSSFDFTIPPFGGYPGTLGADGGLSLGLAFLNDIQVFMLLEAAQGDQRNHIMQAPKITVFNAQTANISVQDQMFFLTGVSIAQAGSQTFFLPQNQPFPVGVGMQVTPVVSADRRFVRLNLVPQITNLVTANVPLIPVQIPIPQLFDAPNGQGYISSQPVIFQMFFQQPTFTTINVNTTVNVPDGGTVLLGGLKTLAEGRLEFGPPILSKIPYISRLFRNQNFGREAQSVMVMVTPRIIINEEIEQEILGTVPPIPR